MSEIEALIEDLLLCLDRERSAVIEGRFEALEETLETKERLLEDLSSLAVEEIPTNIETVRSKMVENEGLLIAAQTGFSQASSRIGEIREAIGQLKTYDGAGKVKSSLTTEPTVSLKA